LGRGDAMADEDRLGVELFKLLLRLAGARKALLAEDVERGFALHRSERRIQARDDAHQGAGLEVGAALADRLEAGLLELGREIFRGEDLTARSGAAAFQSIARQVGDGGLDALGGNLGSW